MYYFNSDFHAQSCPYLKITIWPLGDKGDINRKEVVWMAVDAEFHGPRLVRLINDRQGPLENVFAVVIVILSFTLADIGGTHPRPAGHRERQLKSIGAILGYKRTIRAEPWCVTMLFKTAC